MLFLPIDYLLSNYSFLNLGLRIIPDGINFCSLCRFSTFFYIWNFVRNSYHMGLLWSFGLLLQPVIILSSNWISLEMAIDTMFKTVLERVKQLCSFSYWELDLAWFWATTMFTSLELFTLVFLVDQWFCLSSNVFHYLQDLLLSRMVGI